MTREQRIIRTSILGILANVFLASFKAAVGVVTNSIAVTLDAVNNLSDALSSVITIIGTRLAGKAPDKEHPLGHGRIEYLTAMIIAVIVLYAGVTSFVESGKKIIHPETPDYSAAALMILAVAVLVKILLGRYVKAVGLQLSSDSLIASGEDARLDSIISASTLLAAFVYLLWGLSLEAWLGAAISVVIIRSGIEMLRSSISELLGERVTAQMSKEIKDSITAFPDVSGAYDLVLHNYGPDTLIGSVHIEVPDTYSIGELDQLERDIQHRVYEKHGVILTGISVYSRNTSDSEAERILGEIRKVVMRHEHVLQLHGFYLNRDSGEIRFDVILDFAAEDPEAEVQAIEREIQPLYPGYGLRITLDRDISD